MGNSCSRARERLWPPERPRLADGEILEARRHVEDCAACQEYFRQDRMLLAAYARLKELEAPRPTKDRVFDRLAQERVRPTAPTGSSAAPGTTARAEPAEGAPAVASRIGPMPRRGIHGVVAVAVFAAVALPGYWTYSSVRRAAPEGAVFVEDYLRRAVGEDHIQTSDPDHVARFLTRELGMTLAPLVADGLELTGAEICLLDGRRGAMIKYVRNGRVISHYLVPRQDASDRPPSLTERSVRPGPGSPPPVVTWATGSLEQALVGGSSSDELLSIARAAFSQ